MQKEIIVISALWCPSCLLLKKELKKIHEEYNLNFKTLDYDLDEDEVNRSRNLCRIHRVMVYGLKMIKNLLVKRV